MKNALIFFAALVFYVATLSSSLGQPGSLDITFNPGSGLSGGPSVGAIVIQTNGQAVIGGSFSRINGVARNRVGRLNSDGSLDNSFDPGDGPDGQVQALAIQTDGKVIIGGQFFSVNGLLRRAVARLRTNGSLDTAFDPGLGFDGFGSQSTAAYVAGVALQPDGKAVIGGGFTSYNGFGVTNVTRLDGSGSLDFNFHAGSGTDRDIRTIALQTNGQILIAGYFRTVQGSNRPCVARLNADGNLDSNFDAGLFVGNSDPYVRTLVIRFDGKILVGGSFTSINGYTRHNIARLMPDGSLDLSFNPRYGANADVRTIASQPDGKVLIGGSFYLVNDTPRNFVARLNEDGSVDSAYTSALDNSGAVFALALQSDGKLLIGGAFTSIGGTARNYIARLNGDASGPVENRFLNIRLYAGMLLTGTDSNQYRVEYATNLGVPTLWRPLTNLNFPSSPFLFIDVDSLTPTRFYRAVTLP